MSTMNVSLPVQLKDFVYSQVSHGHYGSTSEYVRELIRQDRARRELREALLEGASAPVVGQADAAYFAALRHRISDT